MPPDSQPETGESTYPGIAVDKLQTTGMTGRGQPKARRRNSRGTVSAWSTATVPKGMEFIGRKTKRLWVEAYDEVARVHGSVSFKHRNTLKQMVRLETWIQLCEKKLRDRENEGTLKDETFISLGKEITRTAERLDKMVDGLGLTPAGSQSLADLIRGIHAESANAPNVVVNVMQQNGKPDVVEKQVIETTSALIETGSELAPA